MLHRGFDDILLAIVLAMFVRAFVLELFKIPTGSMTPTLVGDSVAEVDFDGDGRKDLLVLKPQIGPDAYQIYLTREEGYRYEGLRDLRPDLFKERREEARRRLHPRFDRIIVCKFSCWFRPPRRGDLIVFKTPGNIWQLDKPVFIKRAAALGGETAAPEGATGVGGFANARGLAIDGTPVVDPPIFKRLFYSDVIHIFPDAEHRAFPPPEGVYVPMNAGVGYRWRWKSSRVPEGRFLPLGDNTDDSYDGRFWGTVPYENIKGTALFRYWPPRNVGFLK